MPCRGLRGGSSLARLLPVRLSPQQIVLAAWDSCRTGCPARHPKMLVGEAQQLGSEAHVRAAVANNPQPSVTPQKQPAAVPAPIRSLPAPRGGPAATQALFLCFGLSIDDRPSRPVCSGRKELACWWSESNCIQGLPAWHKTGMPKRSGRVRGAVSEARTPTTENGMVPASRRQRQPRSLRTSFGTASARQTTDSSSGSAGDREEMACGCPGGIKASLASLQMAKLCSSAMSVN